MFGPAPTPNQLTVVPSRCRQAPPGSNAPRIAAYSGEKVTLTRGSNSIVLNFQNSYVQYIVFDGFVIDATGAESGIKIQGGAHHVRIQNCEVKNALGQGILMTGGTATHHNEILRCDVHDHGKDLHYDHGIYIAASDNLVEDCKVHNNLAYGVHVYDGSTSAAHQNIIRRVKSYSNGATGILIGSGTGNLAYNNIVYANGQVGIQVGFNAIDNKVYNNTVYKNGAEGIQIRNTSSGTRVTNNIIYSTPVDINNKGANTTLSNNLTTDPLFVNAAGSNFRLKSGSTAIDKGVTLSEVSDDYEGTPRPAGSSYDTGADEHTISTAPPSAPKSLEVNIQAP
jgi:parallel beta-helix repeat protein